MSVDAGFETDATVGGLLLRAMLSAGPNASPEVPHLLPNISTAV